MSTNINELINIRFKIIKVLKDAKKELTLEEIMKECRHGCSTLMIEDYNQAIIDLDNKGILNVKYEAGYAAHCYKRLGSSVISCSLY